ncbi:MAG TPA: DUF308 domain-containing protein [Gemmatimonadales bacterium]|nr:DUF308 domain-containing protein [Gemmatimonadales bacterium]
MLSLTRNWWLVALRGLLLLLLGLAALFWPGITLAVLVIWVGAALFVNGLIALAVAIAGRDVEGRAWLVIEGVLGILAGIFTFIYPGLTQFALLWVVAAWAIVAGIAQVAAAIQFRKVIQGEWLLGLAGVLAIVFGVLLFVYPIAGLVTLALLIGWFAILYGAALIALGVRLRGLRDTLGAGLGTTTAGF